MTERAALLELLAENFPPRALASAADQLRAAAAAEFAAAGLGGAQPEVFATCRRLALYAPGVPAGQKTAALAGILARAVCRVRFPGALSWDSSGFLFPRPLRGIVALHGERLLPLSLAGLKACRFTAGHDSGGPRRVEVQSAEKYFKALEHACVLVKDAERLAFLQAGLAAAQRRMKLVVEADASALGESLCRAEYPVAVVSGFSQELLALPAARVRQELRRLRFFPVADAAGRLQPYFAGVRDGASKGQRNVEEGFRRALEAALAAAPLEAGPARAPAA